MSNIKGGDKFIGYIFGLYYVLVELNVIEFEIKVGNIRDKK